MKAEANTQKANIAYLGTGSPVPFEVIKIDNEGRQGNNYGQKAQGMRKGASDLILIFDAVYQPSTIFCETKTRRIEGVTKLNQLKLRETKQSDSQIEFQDSVTKLKQWYWLCPQVLHFCLYFEFWCNYNGLETRLTTASRNELYSDGRAKFGHDLASHFDVPQYIKDLVPRGTI